MASGLLFVECVVYIQCSMSRSVTCTFGKNVSEKNVKIPPREGEGEGEGTTHTHTGIMCTKVPVHTCVSHVCILYHTSHIYYIHMHRNYTCTCLELS